jgi:hypothetical protein
MDKFAKGNTSNGPRANKQNETNTLYSPSKADNNIRVEGMDGTEASA